MPRVTPSEIVASMSIVVGKRPYPIRTFAEASAMFCAARDAFDGGASEIAEPEIRDHTGKVIAQVSYNGRVWPVDQGFQFSYAGMTHGSVTPLYDPQAAGKTEGCK